MKRGTEYAKRLKKAFQQWSRDYGSVDEPEMTDPLEEVVIAILADCLPREQARALYDKLFEQMVDLNELRVTPAVELAGTLGKKLPLAEQKAERVVSALNDIRRRQDTMDLTFLRQRGRRESREYLESLEGLGKQGTAWVVQLSLGGHAIPVDDLTLYVLRKEELVEPTATAEDVQSFLERHIQASESKQYVLLQERFVADRSGRASIAKLPELLNPPPPKPPKPAPEKKEAKASSKKKASEKKTVKKSSTSAKKAKASTKKKSAQTGKASKKKSKKTTKKKTATTRTKRTARHK
jgi:endonuclease-3